MHGRSGTRAVAYADRVLQDRAAHPAFAAFRPLWPPSFISEVMAKDRCHLKSGQFICCLHGVTPLLTRNKAPPALVRFAAFPLPAVSPSARRAGRGAIG